MSADLLCRAAVLMREHAETESILRDGDPYYAVQTMPDGSLITEMGQYEMRWHPTVALEVAKLLQAQVDYWVDGEGPCVTSCTHADCEATNALLPLARAYLGGDA